MIFIIKTFKPLLISCMISMMFYIDSLASDDNNPIASVEYDNIEYMNGDAIGATVTLDSEYRIVTVDTKGNEVIGELLTPGTYDVDIPAYTGNNTVTIYIEDENGNRKSFTKSFIKDVTAPQLSIIGEIDGISTYDDAIVISGTVHDYLSLTISSNKVNVYDNGNFDFTYNLRVGSNDIVISACDEAGNVTEYTATVTKLVYTPKNYKPLIRNIVLVVSILVLIAIFIVFKRKGVFERFALKKIDQKNKGSVSDKKYEKKKMWIDVIRNTVIMVALYIFVTKCVIDFAYIPSDSMEPTIMTGNVTVCNRLAYLFRKPERGDIITFYNREQDKYMIKRVIGLPGDKITLRDGSVFVNDMLLDESYIAEDVETNPFSLDGMIYGYEVPENCYFVMGDNREVSGDSRAWENPYISFEDIIAKYIFTLY